MPFFRYTFIAFLFLVALLKAQEPDSMEDTDKLDSTEDLGLEAVEEIEELPPTSAPDFITFDRKDINQLTGELTHEKQLIETIGTLTTQAVAQTNQVINESTQMTDETTEQSAQVTSDGTQLEDKTEAYVIFEEVDANTQLNDLKGESSDFIPVFETSTESEIGTTINPKMFDEIESQFSFSCYGRPFGQYADIEQECRVFHLCYPFFNSTTNELLYQRVSFLCDNNSFFDQKRFVCVDNSTIDHKCTDSEQLYLTTNQEYLIRVFSQSTSANTEVKDQQVDNQSNNNQSWFQWLRN